MRYAVNSKSKQTWRNSHPRVLLSAVRKDLLRESERKRRDRACSRKYRLQQIMIGAEADRWKELKARVGEGREPCVVVPIRSTWHPRAFAYISRFHSSSHVTRSKHLRRNKWRNPLCVFKIACLFFSFLATRKHFTAV